jgi:hypothetical protein
MVLSSEHRTIKRRMAETSSPGSSGLQDDPDLRGLLPSEREADLINAAFEIGTGLVPEGTPKTFEAAPELPVSGAFPRGERWDSNPRPPGPQIGAGGVSGGSDLSAFALQNRDF